MEIGKCYSFKSFLRKPWFLVARGGVFYNSGKSGVKNFRLVMGISGRRGSISFRGTGKNKNKYLKFKKSRRTYLSSLVTSKK